MAAQIAPTAAFEVAYIDQPNTMARIECPPEAWDERIPMYAVTRVPDTILGEGNNGQVYRIDIEGRKAVFKLRFADKTMADSLLFSLGHSRHIRNLRDSPHYPKSFGILYVFERNIWGVISEFIEGKNLPKSFQSRREALAVMKDLAEGMGCIAEQGYPYTDCGEGNILLTAEGRTVMIDDVARSGGNEVDQRSSIEEFGSLLCQTFAQELPDPAGHLPERWIALHRQALTEELGAPLASLICKCLVPFSNNGISWPIIIKTLEEELTLR